MKMFFNYFAPLTRPVTLIALLISLMGGAVFVTPAHAATISVNTTIDEFGSGANCSLREAIRAANTDAAFGGCAAGSGTDTINLPSGTYTLTLTNSGGANEDADASGDLDVLNSLTIQGAGAGSTIIQAGTNTSNGIDKVIALNPICISTVNVTIDGVTISYGRNTQPTNAADISFTGGGVDWCGFGASSFTLSNSIISNNTNVNGYGGGMNIDSVAVYTGSINITNVIFDNNQTNGATGGQSTGGALNIFGAQPAITITNSTFSNNRTLPTTSGGAGIYYRPTNGGSLAIHNSDINGNISGGNGGGIYVNVSSAAGTIVTIDQGTQIRNNVSGGVSGGSAGGSGLFLGGGVLTTTPMLISKVTISGNHDGASATSFNGGGGILIQEANVTLQYSRIVNNTLSAGTGTGLYKNVDTGTVTATNNWWGCSTGPGAAPCDTAVIAGGSAGSINYTPYFRVLTTSGTATVVTNQTTSLTASVNMNSSNTDVSANVDRLLGQAITWSAVNGTISGADSSISSVGGTKGTGAATFTATAAGAGKGIAKVDNDSTTGAGSNIASITINKANTTASILNGATLSSTPSVTGQPVTVSYSVIGAFGNSPTAPTGNVTVSDGTDSCTATVAAGQCNITFRTTGAKTLTATYAGDVNFNASPASTSASHTVNKANTTTTITSDTPDPSVTGQLVTFNVTVAATAPGAVIAPTTITGTVVVSDGGTNTCNATLTAGVGSCTINFPGTGFYSMTGTYGGNSNFNGSTSVTNSHTVNKASTTTVIVSDTPDPSSSSESVTVNFTVNVTSPGAGTPSGNVTVGDGVDSCIGTVAAGTCSLTLTTGGARTLTATYVGDGNFSTSSSTGSPHNVSDVTPPSLISFTLQTPAASPTNADSLTFLATFSEAVTGVDMTDFVKNTTSTALITSVVQVTTSTYSVTISGGDLAGFNGAVNLNLSGTPIIADLASIPLPSSEPSTDATYIVDNSAPSVVSSLRANTSPTSAAGVDFTVTFSEPVTGVDATDFSLTTSGVSGATVSGVGGSGSVYTVNVNTGTGNGTIHLDVVNDNSISDIATNPLVAGFTNGETYTINKSATFTDVPLSYWASSFIERLYNVGITGGCSTTPPNYCPDSTVTRAQMAVFILKGMHGSGFTPPNVGTGTGYTDVAINYWAATWIKQLSAEGITSGCGNGNYCPEATVTRAQMAIFLLKAKHGSSYSPPTATGVFTDVPVGYWADKWIERLAVEGVTSGCGNGNYCPEDSVTRAQMAVFLVKAFGLP